MPELIRLVDCSFTYRNTREPVLQNINIALNRGDRVLLAGKSGSGKSTLLALLAGLVPEYIPGRVDGVAEYAEACRALVMQNPEAQIVTPSVFEEAAFALENKAVAPAEIEARVNAVLAAAGLTDKRDRHPLTLSGGECQRVSLAAALAQKADILFMDEPLSYLDDRSSRELVDLLKREAADTTAVIVEHRLELFSAYCNRYFRIENKTLVECGREDLMREHCVYSAGWEKRGKTVNAGSGAPVLTVRNLRHAFGTHAVLNNVSFDVHAGEIVVLMGESGSGKTTILNKITKTLATKRGEVVVAGKDVTTISARSLYAECFAVPQNPEHMFIADTVRKELACSGKSTEDYLARFGLSDKALRHPFSLSEGEKRRLNLCVALALERKLLLLDEPTYGLDFESVEKIIDDVIALKKAGRAVVIVTHDTKFAEAVQDRCLVLTGGMLRENLQSDSKPSDSVSSDSKSNDSKSNDNESGASAESIRDALDDTERGAV